MQTVARKQYSYRILRGLQISTVFFVTIVVQESVGYQHAGWTGFAVMMIYAGFDNGATLQRAYHRFLGVLLGLFSGYVLWFLGHVDFRLLIFIIPITVFCIYYWAGTAYSIPTIFTVNTSILGFGYFDSQSMFTVGFYMIDYFMCTIMAFAIILTLEYFWFRRYQMMRRFIEDTQAEILKNLYTLVHLLNQDKIRRTDWFRACITFTGSIFEMNRLLLSAHFLVTSEHAVGDEFNQFVVLTNRIFVSLKALYLAYYTKSYRKYDYYQLVEKTQADLLRLRAFIADESFEHTTYGAGHATS